MAVPALCTRSGTGARTERHVLELTFGVNGLERAVYTEVTPNGRREHRLFHTQGATITPAARNGGVHKVTFH